ncbi:LytTR family DNA-binding domain-containing protein [Aquimarina sp. 2201CG5-10]|uniref:LytTR family DNA-binding domain-containing protein n=1 Tax=Aquimarina callyspongiae TaxID=3098150 RepID=UPI002AB3F036|nr:LytTR family DNA-binding domain-containing protein [Aquimarina sp. 2201CG5-10]MDY8138884.1 LytTR family DNA-binding domain-containing protein [Aquimarina sp. 2201CG5-10]
MPKEYPFDPSFKHHFLVALGLALWIFVFLYFTEPLDVNEFGNTEKLIYLPFYGIVGAFGYLLMLPLQQLIYKHNNRSWYISSELIFILLVVSLSFVLSRVVYLHIIMAREPNPYTLPYYITNIYLPAVSTILPIILIGRWSLGKYKSKKLEDQKIEIKGEGNYENLRLLFNDIICIQSSDNYIEVSFLQNNSLKKQLIRNKLSSIAGELPQLLQVHRSYLINPYHFVQWKPEKGKLNLILEQAIEVPVSKTYQETVKATFNFTTKSI